MDSGTGARHPYSVRQGFRPHRSEQITGKEYTMKKHLLLFIALTSFALCGCNDEDSAIIGSVRTFEVVSTTTDWPNSSPKAISRTYEVTIGGAGSTWTVELLDGTQGFILEPDYKSGQFTVSIEENLGKTIRQDWIKVTYSGEMKYLRVVQISDFFDVSLGADLDGGEKGYTVNADGTASYTGDIANPTSSAAIAEYVSGDQVFTPHIVDNTLKFTAAPNVNFYDLEAIWRVYVTGREAQAVEILVTQAGLIVPRGGIGDRTAPGGYYYPLVCGVDVAGVELAVDPAKCWNDYCDPNVTMTAKPSVNEVSPVNPCPSGWALPTEAQMRRMMEQENWTHDPLAERNPGDDYFYWNMKGGERSNGDIFGATYSAIEVRVLGCESRALSDKQVWRMQVNRSSGPSVKVASQAKTAKFNTGNYRSSLRCVRESK